MHVVLQALALAAQRPHHYLQDACLTAFVLLSGQRPQPVPELPVEADGSVRCPCFLAGEGEAGHPQAAGSARCVRCRDSALIRAVRRRSCAGCPLRSATASMNETPVMVSSLVSFELVLDDAVDRSDTWSPRPCFRVLGQLVLGFFQLGARSGPRLLRAINSGPLGVPPQLGVWSSAIFVG